MAQDGPTAKQLACVRRDAAAKLILEAQQKQHAAACMLGDQRAIEQARVGVLAAMEAVLDAHEALMASVVDR